MKGWFSDEWNRNRELSLWNPSLTSNPKPLTNTSTKRESEPSRADWSSNKPLDSSNLESFTRRQSSLTDWSTTAGEVELRHWVIASLPGSELMPRWGGADRSLSKIEITAKLWSEGWGNRVLSSRGEYDSIVKGDCEFSNRLLWVCLCDSTPHLHTDRYIEKKTNYDTWLEDQWET